MYSPLYIADMMCPDAFQTCSYFRAWACHSQELGNGFVPLQMISLGGRMLNVVRKTGGNMHRFGISLTIESPSAWYMQSALDTVRLLENCTVFFPCFFYTASWNHLKPGGLQLHVGTWCLVWTADDSCVTFPVTPSYPVQNLALAVPSAPSVPSVRLRRWATMGRWPANLPTNKTDRSCCGFLAL